MISGISWPSKRSTSNPAQAPKAVVLSRPRRSHRRPRLRLRPVDPVQARPRRRPRISRSSRSCPKACGPSTNTIADFFLELLPGPRDREGLPDSIRFWKRRIEEIDPEKTFSVGLIYGPSGCGKSSLVKAGLLPRLANDVIAVYVEATAAETEVRLLNGLRKGSPALPANLGLKETLARITPGPGHSARQESADRP